jgi:hypothetical protein
VIPLIKIGNEPEEDFEIESILVICYFFIMKTQKITGFLLLRHEDARKSRSFPKLNVIQPIADQVESLVIFHVVQLGI